MARVVFTSRAHAVRARIRKSVVTLASFPRMGQPSRLNQGAKRFSVSPWVVFYRPLDDGEGIEVLRILDGRRDLSDIL